MFKNEKEKFCLTTDVNKWQTSIINRLVFLPVSSSDYVCFGAESAFSVAFEPTSHKTILEI